MSHYTVLVIGEDVEGQLQPYHEFECTGENDQYIQEIDQTEEARAEFQKATATRYKDPEGKLHSPYDAEGNHDTKFWRELTPEEEAQYGSGKPSFFQDHDFNPEHGGLRLYSAEWYDGKPYHAKAFAWPSEGWSEVEVLRKDVETFAEFVADWHGKKPVPFGQQPDLDNDHKYGYCELDANGEVVKVIDRTNPEKKWDWWTLGGRWTGFFKLKQNAPGALGRPGIQRMDPDYKPPKPGYADVCMKGDIDIDGMREEAAKEAANKYDLYFKTIEGVPAPLPWDEIREKHGDGNIEAARNEYHNQPAIKALHNNRDTIFFEPEDFLCTRDEYIDRARKHAITTFAVVKDSKWYERGEMGWWGVVHDEKDLDAWENEFAALIDGLPDDTLLSVVDCHI